MPPATRTPTRDLLLAFAQIAALGIFVSLSVLFTQWIFNDPGEMGTAGDFTSFWTASELTLQGRAADAYSEPPHFAAQKALFRNQDRGYLTFMYPPTYLLLCLPLALVPFATMAAIWIVTTTAAWFAAILALLRPRYAVLFLAYPAVFTNAGYGQNGALSGALLGGAAWALDRRPVFAGVCIGLLSYKPHMGLLLPLALAITRRWRCFLTAAATVAVLCVLTTLVIGPDIWSAYAGRGPDARRWLESDDTSYLEKWITLFGAVRLHGGGLGLAYALQAFAGVLAGGAVLASVRRDTQGVAIIAAVTAAIPFCSPFMLEYDLMILAVPMAWLIAEGTRTGFLRGELASILFAWFAPALFKVTLWQNAFKLLVLLSTATLLLAVLRRIRTERNPA